MSSVLLARAAVLVAAVGVGILVAAKNEAEAEKVKQDNERSKHRERRERNEKERREREERRKQREREEEERRKRREREEQQRQREEEERRKRQERQRKEKNRKERRSRLANGQTAVLYHQTDRKAARAIQKSKRMLRGSSGLAGGGIYFATCKADTENKALAKGYIIKARVKLGNVKTISAQGDGSLSFRSLLDDGYDSVVIPRPNGAEYVVYNWDQVQIVKVKKKGSWGCGIGWL